MGVILIYSTVQKSSQDSPKQNWKNILSKINSEDSLRQRLVSLCKFFPLASVEVPAKSFTVLGNGPSYKIFWRDQSISWPWKRVFATENSTDTNNRCTQPKNDAKQSIPRGKGRSKTLFFPFQVVGVLSKKLRFACSKTIRNGSKHVYQW